MMILEVRLVNPRPRTDPLFTGTYNSRPAASRALVSCRTMRHGPTLLLSVFLFAGNVDAGEVSGLPQNLAPATRPDYAYFLGNDFAASGTSDDFRTGQMAITGRFGDSWVAVLDHSIFTRQDELNDRRGRIDTMTASIGFEILDVDASDRRTSIVLGAALRAIADLEGERVQNGVHRLIESDTERIPYTDTEQLDPAAWFLGEHFRELRAATGEDFFGSWSLGYWARLGALGTFDGQLDAMAGLYAVAKRRQVNLWLGVRRDWRTGYDTDFVLRDAAHEEAKFAVALGARFGALVIESVQRIDSSASYGQLSFISSPDTRRRSAWTGPVRFDFQAALQLPHVTFQLASRWHRQVLIADTSPWREALFAEIRGGQPQLGSDPTLFVDTGQVTLGMEWSRAILDHSDWLRFYSNAGLGWRSERLLLRDESTRGESEKVDRGVAAAEAGLEIAAAPLGERVQFKLRLGVTAWLPFGDATVAIGDTTATIQDTGASLALGWVFAYR